MVWVFRIHHGYGSNIGFSASDRERQWFSEPDLPLDVDHRSVAHRMGLLPSSTSATKKHGFATSTITGTPEECLDKSWCLNVCTNEAESRWMPIYMYIYPRPIPVSVQKCSCISWCPMIPMIGGTSACAHRAEALSNAGGLILLKKLLGLCCLQQELQEVLQSDSLGWEGSLVYAGVFLLMAAPRT